MISYDEIIKLDDMLNEANIPHTFDVDMFDTQGRVLLRLISPNYYPAYQIIVFNDKNERLCDAIYHYYSYGYYVGLLEIAGGLTEEEQEVDGVLGYLTADDVFKRFKYCYENNTSTYKEVI